MIDDFNVCGQCCCHFKYNCLIKKQCSFHNGQCFSCSPCKPISALIKQCSQCQRHVYSDQIYQSNNGHSLFCRFEFIRLNIVDNSTIQVGQCTENLKDVLKFMKNYCSMCGRKILLNGLSQFQQNMCAVCLGLIQFHQQINDSQNNGFVQKQKNNQKIINLQTINNNSIINLQFQSFRNKIQQQLQIMKNNMIQKQNKNSIMIQQMKDMLIKQADIECMICLQQYDLQNHKPYMLCINQHPICDLCRKDKNIKCPLCGNQTIINGNTINEHRTMLKLLKIKSICKEVIIDKNLPQMKIKEESQKKQKNYDVYDAANDNSNDNYNKGHKINYSKSYSGRCKKVKFNFDKKMIIKQKKILKKTSLNHKKLK